MEVHIKNTVGSRNVVDYLACNKCRGKLMGYNNNYAGMHLICFNHYGKYEDLGYYDRLVASVSFDISMS